MLKTLCLYGALGGLTGWLVTFVMFAAAGELNIGVLAGLVVPIIWLVIYALLGRR